MAEAFHEWVRNMPWYERLYYEIFDPQAITCSTYSSPPLANLFFWGLIGIGVTALILLVLSRRYRIVIEKESK